MLKDGITSISFLLWMCFKIFSCSKICLDPRSNMMVAPFLLAFLGAKIKPVKDIRILP